MSKLTENIKKISEQILEFLLDYKDKNPSFTFSIRQRESAQNGEAGRFEKGQWFQGSNYIYVPLFKKGDQSRKIKTIGFVVHFDKKTGELENTGLSISFKGGKFDDNEIAYHKELARLAGVPLKKDRYGFKIYDNPKDVLGNLSNYIGHFRDYALALLQEYDLDNKYIISEDEFQKTLTKINQLRNSNIIDKPDMDDNSKGNNQTCNNSYPLNQILYGPPGTGKTYATKGLAVKIANPGFQGANTLTQAEQRQEISKEYKRLFDAGQIVFTTFHQSMSYEDFVEGIKPETLDNDVVYNVQPGLLKLLCEKASLKSNSNFEEVLEHFKENVMNNQPYTIETGRSKFDVFYRGGLTFRINPHESTNVNPNYPASIENLLKYYQTDSVEGIYNPSYIRGIINHLYDEYGLVKYNDVAESPDKNYVLIIDEINRGNVSAIFGELITLLEADKRIGAPEEISLKLPYSKTEFGVPSNLYIIGTMNTADRSVEALDTALRRRFSFVEVMPNHDILDREVEGFNLKNILETINNRVEALLDRDHTIGHSYFIKVNDKASMVHAFKNCIIPLLQEYFYGDYEKINLVLGDGFICKDTKNSVTFAGNNLNSGYGSTERYIFPELTEENINSAIKKLLNIKEAAQTDESTEEENTGL